MKTVHFFPYPHSYWHTCNCNCTNKYSLHHGTCRYSITEKHTWWEYSHMIKNLKIFALSKKSAHETMVLNVQNRYLESVVVAHLDPLSFEIYNWGSQLNKLSNVTQIFHKLIVNLCYSTIHWKYLNKYSQNIFKNHHFKKF